MHGYQVAITPIASHFQTWSMSIGFKMKPLRGNCKVMWFSININALGNATRARKHNLFYLPSDPSHIYQSIQIDSTVYGPDLPEFVSPLKSLPFCRISEMNQE